MINTYDASFEDAPKVFNVISMKLFISAFKLTIAYTLALIKSYVNQAE